MQVRRRNLCVRLKLFININVAVSAHAIKDQVNHIDLLCAAIGVGFHPHIVTKRPRRYLAQLQFIAQLFADLAA